MIIISLFIRFFLIFQEIDVVLEKLVADDLFYYHTIAKNIIDGKGVVFNEGVNTNGFHLLYLILLIPLHFLSPNNINTPIYGSLILTSIFSVFTSIFIYKIVEKIMDTQTGIIASGIWLFSPSVIFISLIGLETNLQVFLISILTHHLIKWGRKANYTPNESIIIGILCGLIFLSRMDGVFLIISIFIVLLFRKLRLLDSIKTIFKIYKTDLLIIGGFALLLIFPWLLWSFINCHSFLPDSSKAIRLLKRTPYISCALYFGLNTLSYFGGDLFTNYDILLIGTPTIICSISLVILLIIDRKFLIKTALKFDFLIVTAIFFYSYYIFYHRYFQWWYVNFPYFICGLFLPIIIFRAIKTISLKLKNKSKKKKKKKIPNHKYYKKKNRQVLLISLFFCFLIPNFVTATILHYNSGSWPCEKTKYVGALWIDENLPEDSVIGSFNTGIVQYYTKNFDIINLDGVVNYEAFIAHEQDAIEQYILEKRINYIIDIEKYTRNLEFPSHNLIIIHKFNTGCGEIYYLYHLTPNI